MQMPSNRWFRGILMFGAALVAGGVLAGCRGQLSESPPIHPNPNMDFQKRYDPQEPSTFFSDGRAMRKPVAGTVARPPHSVKGKTFVKNDPHLYTGMVNGKFANKLPKQIKLTDALLKRGQNRYNIFCTACHGKTGNGKGVVTLYSSGINPRNFHEVRTIALGQIYSAMFKGAGTMKPYNSQLTVEDRWAVAAYVRALQLTRKSFASR
ncbi:MAG: cytochrome c [Deltaproteobacteria bacterium]|nr:MAG: cytochrome c [Deltaproteobacteria bacterium]